MTAQLRMEAQSEAAQAAAAEAAQRLQHAGREPGWSLHLNPTPALIEQSGLPDSDSYRAAQRFTEYRRATEYRRQLQERERGQDGLEL